MAHNSLIEWACDISYKLIVFKQSYKSSLHYFTFQNSEIPTELKLDVELELENDFKHSSENDVIVNINAHSIYFDTNSANLKLSSTIALNKILAIMRKYPKYYFAIHISYRF
jgi:outer membrane protein OmpA-like peptidoglycan-associated protein